MSACLKGTTALENNGKLHFESDSNRTVVCLLLTRHRKEYVGMNIDTTCTYLHSVTYEHQQTENKYYVVPLTWPVLKIIPSTRFKKYA